MEKYDDEELGALGKLLDEHIDWDKDGEGGGSSRPKYTKEELKQIRDEVREAALQYGHELTDHLRNSLRQY